MERILKIRTSRQPHEVMVMISAVIIGAVGAFVPTKISPAIEEVFTNSGARAYFILMGVFGMIVLVSMKNRNIESMLVEKSGLIVLFFVFFAYSAAVLLNSGIMALVPVILPSMLAMANVFRAWQISRDLKLLKAFLKDQRSMIPTGSEETE